MNIIFWWIVAILVVVLLPEAIIYVGGIFCILYDKLFNKEYKHSEKIRKEFRKNFKNPSYKKIGELKDEHYEKNHNKENFERLTMTEFAVKYIDPTTNDYNETYIKEWGNV